MMPAAEIRPEIRIDPSKGDPSKKLVTESSRIEDFSLTKTPLRGVPPAEEFFVPIKPDLHPKRVRCVVHAFDIDCDLRKPILLQYHNTIWY